MMMIGSSRTNIQAKEEEEEEEANLDGEVFVLFHPNDQRRRARKGLERRRRRRGVGG